MKDEEWRCTKNMFVQDSGRITARGGRRESQLFFVARNSVSVISTVSEEKRRAERAGYGVSGNPR